MKKISIYLLALITLAFANNSNLSPNAAINPGAIIPPTIAGEMPTNMVGYFKNLKVNFGLNEMNSCAYVAVAMLLSYYDTFYNDDIIPEQYDEISSGNNFYNMKYNSPGIRKEPVINASSEAAYYSAIAQYQNDYFHSYLLLQMRVLGFSLLLSDEEIMMTLRYSFVINNNININDLNFTEKQYSILYDISSNDVRQFAIDQIQSGNPVILSATKSGNLKHAFIAYDYDANTDTIYGHMGWDENNTYIDIDGAGYNFFEFCTAIEWNGVHKCSDNYEVYGISACPCGYIESHNHYIGYNGYITIPLDNYAHRYYCYCGYNETTSHNYTYIINKGYYKCNECLHISNVSIGINRIEG